MVCVDIIAAVRDEEETIPEFLARLDALQLPAGVVRRVTFVEDSSTDGTRLLLRNLAKARADVTYYTLEKGFGQGMALVFGLSRSKGDAMVLMDVDGSHPLDVIPEMVSAFLGGARVVQCVRRSLVNRRAYRHWGAAGFFNGARLLTGIDLNEQRIYYRLVSADIARELLAAPQYWNYLRFPLPRQPEGVLRMIPVDTEERRLGESKYNFRRLVVLAVDAVLSLLSESRAFVLAALVLVADYLLARAGHWTLAIVLSLGLAFAAARYRALRRPELLDEMRVLESGNAPPPSR